MVETVHLAHMPPDLAVYVALYRNVENAAFLKEQLLAGNAEFEYAFIDASMVISTKHVLAAAFRAMNDYLNDRIKSRNIHSEIVFALSPNNNIGEAFRRFGVSETTSNLLVLKVATSPDITLGSVSQHLAAAVKGEACPFNDRTLKEMSDIARIKKVYKLTSTNPGTAGPNGQKSGHAYAQEEQERQLEAQILGSMALRGAA